LNGISHTIRLRGFWETVDEGGRTRHSRNFGRPRLVDESEHIWLVCSTLIAPAEVRLNGEFLEGVMETGPFATEITTRIRPRNTVSITLPIASQLPEVAIEIRRLRG
jgi:hypothetical protein